MALIESASHEPGLEALAAGTNNESLSLDDFAHSNGILAVLASRSLHLAAKQNEERRDLDWTPESVKRTARATLTIGSEPVAPSRQECRAEHSAERQPRRH